jgi:hypothetical protein
MIYKNDWSHVYLLKVMVIYNLKYNLNLKRFIIQIVSGLVQIRKITS